MPYSAVDWIRQGGILVDELGDKLKFISALL